VELSKRRDTADERIKEAGQQRSTKPHTTALQAHMGCWTNLLSLLSLFVLPVFWCFTFLFLFRKMKYGRHGTVRIQTQTDATFNKHNKKQQARTQPTNMETDKQTLTHRHISSGVQSLNLATNAHNRNTHTHTYIHAHTHTYIHTPPSFHSANSWLHAIGKLLLPQYEPLHLRCLELPGGREATHSATTVALGNQVQCKQRCNTETPKHTHQHSLHWLGLRRGAAAVAHGLQDSM